MAQKVAARMLCPREAVPVPGELCGSRAAPRNLPAAPISCPQLPRVLSLLDERLLLPGIFCLRSNYAQ